MSPNGYNLTSGGEGAKRFPLPPKTRSKISVTQRKKSPFKNLIKEIDRCQLSYATLAKLMNLSRKILSTKIQGKQNFMETEWVKLAEVFSKPVEYLMVRCDGLPAITSLADKNLKISVARRHNIIFKNLACEIDKCNLSYRGLAKLLELSASSVSMKMRGEQNFTAEDIAKLIEIFGKPAEYLLKRDDTE